MHQVNEDRVKKAVERAREYAIKNNHNFICSYEEKPEAWKEMANLVISEDYTARQLYEAANQEALSAYSGIKDNPYWAVNKENSIRTVPWDFISFECDNETYRIFAVTKQCYRIFVSILRSSW